MLRLIIGRAGSGKTKYARELAKELVQKGEHPVLIVPEQYSFETERAMLSMLGAASAHNVEVLSFSRLAERISRLSGERQADRLDRCSRAAAMSVALERAAEMDELAHYSPGRRRTDLVLHLLDAVIELKQCAVTAQMLETAAKGADGILGEKLSELSKIYGMYDAVTERCDPLDALDELCERLSTSDFFSGRTVIFDSFKGFTGQEFAVIGRIMRRCADCVICLYADKSEHFGLFEPVAQTAEKLVSIARENGAKVAVPTRLEDGYRFANDEIKVLEKSLFRTGSEAYDGNADNVAVYTASGRYDEMDFCARESRRLIREEGYRCRDIAVIARNDAMYSDIACDAFAKQGLPLFFDRRADVESSSLIRFVCDALCVAAQGRSTDDMLRIAKSGLVADILPDDAFEMENYCLIWGVRGSQWKEPFIQNPDGLRGDLSENQRTRLESINRVRERVEGLTSTLREQMTGGTGRDMAAAVYRLAESAGVKQRLDPKSENDGQIWQVFVSLLDRIADVLGDTRPSVSDFADLFLLMCSLADVGHIPQGQDEVVFSSPERFRASAPKAVFIVGAADGEFPANPAETGVFSDDERKKLIELGLPVSQPFEGRILEERLLAYIAVTCASDKVYITYPENSSIPGDETSGIASELISETLRLLPKAKKLRYSAKPDAIDTEAPEAAFMLYARAVRSDDEGLTAALEAELSALDGFSGKIRAVKDAAENAQPSLSTTAAHGIFGKNMSVSPSSAETYFHCRFKYFCQNALLVRARQKAQVSSNIYGTLLHYVFEKYLSEQCEGDITQNVHELIERFISEEIGGAEGKGARLIGRIRAAEKPCITAVTNLLEELCAGDFKPAAFELKLNGDETRVVLPDGTQVAVRGTVDRVDTFECGGKTYLRVIDYKTGNIDFRLSNVLEGFNMQMLMYLAALCTGGQFAGSIPAGVLYCPSYTEDISAEKNTPKGAVSHERDKKSRRKGMIIDGTDDYAIAKAMEHGLEGRFLPISEKNGAIKESSNGHLVTPEGFSLIREYIKCTLARMAKGLRDGEISPNPDEGACDWCEYAEICRFEGDKRKIAKLDAQSSLGQMEAILREEMERDGTADS